MRKIISLVILFFLFTAPARAQGNPSLNYQYAFTTSGTTTAVNVIGKGVTFWAIKANTSSGSLPSACTAVLQTSPDNVTFATGISLDCTTNTESAITLVNAAYVRVNVSTLTRVNNSTTTINIIGYIEPPFAISTVTPSNNRIQDGDGTTLADVDTTSKSLFVSDTPTATALAYDALVLTGLTTAVDVKASAGNLYGFSIYNGHSAACYLQFFNVAAASVTLGTTVPTFVAVMPITSGSNVFPANALKAFSTAISVASTTTPTGSTVCVVSTTGTISYK